MLVLTSITGGNRTLEVPADRINLEFVLGNKVMVGSVNASRDNFETGVRDMSQAEAEYPGWLRQLLTHPVRGLESYRELFDALAKSQRRDQDLLRGNAIVTCREFADFMADYLSGELPAGVRSAFDHHLRLCPNCQQYLAGYEETVKLGKRAFARRRCGSAC